MRPKLSSLYKVVVVGGGGGGCCADRILPVTVPSYLEGGERPFSVYFTAGGLTKFFI
jgi:hypothetical protein